MNRLDIINNLLNAIKDEAMSVVENYDYDMDYDEYQKLIPITEIDDIDIETKFKGRTIEATLKQKDSSAWIYLAKGNYIVREYSNISEYIVIQMNNIYDDASEYAKKCMEENFAKYREIEEYQERLTRWNM